MAQKSYLASLPIEVKLIGGIGIGIAGYFVVKNLLKRNYSKETVTESQREVERQKGNLSYTLTWYKNAADTLRAAMFDAGTDEASIYRVFSQLKNNKDLYQLISAFGVRPYYTFGLKQGDYNLGQWFNEELSDSEINKLNTILKSKKIAFEF